MSERSSPYVSGPGTPAVTNSRRAPGEHSTLTAAPGTESIKPYACVTCSRRKVRCDKSEPCSTCRKSGIECVFRAPAPPQPRKRRAPETILLERLRRAEDLLKGMGVKVDSVDNDNEPRAYDPNKTVAVGDQRSTRPSPRRTNAAVPSAGEQKAILKETVFGENRSNFIRRYGSVACVQM